MGTGDWEGEGRKVRSSTKLVWRPQKRRAPRVSQDDHTPAARAKGLAINIKEGRRLVRGGGRLVARSQEKAKFSSLCESADVAGREEEPGAAKGGRRHRMGGEGSSIQM